MRKYCYSLLLSIIATVGCLALFMKVCSSSQVKHSLFAARAAADAPDRELLAVEADSGRFLQSGDLETVNEPAAGRSPSDGTAISTVISRNPGHMQSRDGVAPDEQSTGVKTKTSKDTGSLAALAVKSLDGDLEISGRVLDSRGQPLEGIQLTVRLYDPDPAAGQAGNPVGVAESSTEGVYEIGALLQGEYTVSTAPTNLFPTATRVLRAGDSAADFVLHAQEDVVASGRVEDEGGEPLPEVEIVPDDQVARSALSSTEGLFKVVFRWNPELPLHTLRFSREGYQEELLRVTEAEFKKGAEDLRVVLREVGDRILVLGVLRTPDGEGIPGETITLYSSEFNASYKAVTSEQGLFRIENVQAGSEYRIRVYPDGDFQDHEQRTFIDAHSSPLKITLKRLGTGSLQGVALDASGVPIPGFTFWVQSAKAGHKGIEVVTGPDGRFELEAVPEGPLVFETRSLPRLSVRGFQMPSSGRRQVSLILDWGNQELKGRVVDRGGQPVPGAQVQLTWTHRSMDLVSTSQRATVSDPSGIYRFSRLGPGPHRLAASLPEHPEASQSLEVEPGAGEADIMVQGKLRDRE